MATARETILAGPFGNLAGMKGLSHVQTLFKNLCDYAKAFYTYSATKVKTSTGELLLGYPHGDLRVVDCASLASMFCIVARENLGLSEKTVGLQSVSSGEGFATKEHSKCFDAGIVGSIRTATENFRAVRRCVFREHWFAQVSGRFYDPCMLTTYEAAEEAKSWVLSSGRGDYYGILYRIEGDAAKLLIRIPEGAGSLPKGFLSSFLQVETKDLDKAAYKAAFRAEKPGWQMKTKSVNQLLQAAGIAGKWPTIP